MINELDDDDNVEISKLKGQKLANFLQKVADEDAGKYDFATDDIELHPQADVEEVQEVEEEKPEAAEGTMIMHADNLINYQAFLEDKAKYGKPNKIQYSFMHVVM